MNPRVLLRSPDFLPERQLLKSSTQSLTSHLARPPSLNFQKSFLFVVSSGGNGGRRALSSPPAGRFMDGGGDGGVLGGGRSGSKVRKGSEGGEGGEEERGCGEGGEKDGNEGDGRGSGEYKGGGASGVGSGVRELVGSSHVGISIPRHREAIDQAPAKRPSEPSVTTKGKLLPTPSQLLKLLLPLQLTGSSGLIDSPLALLVHPLQPLSYLECLIQAKLPPITSPNSPSRPPNISFKAVGLGSPSPSEKLEKGGYVRWSVSAEVGDFVRDVARGKEFVIEIEGSEDVSVSVPNFGQRTHYLRQRLTATAREIELQARLKPECDGSAQRGAQRVAISGFAGLVGWWAGVYWLMFKAGLGWDVLEPVAYLVGLSAVMGGHLLFLYSNHEVLYRSILRINVSKRQTKPCREKGFGVDKWEELVNEGRALRREIKAIAEECDVEWDEWSDRGTQMWQEDEGEGATKR